MIRVAIRLAGSALALLATTSSLEAQGSNVMQHGACATAMVSAAVTDPCRDGSSILYNPAAIALHPGVLTAGVSAIRSESTFTYDEAGREGATQEPTISYVPSGFATYPISDRLAVGLGVFLPYGLGLEWPLSFEGRFTSYDTDLRNLYIQPTVAFALTPQVTLGAGLDFVRSSLAINQRLDFAEIPVPGQPTIRMGELGIPSGTDFADVGLEGEDTGVTFNVGGLVQLTDALELGVRYLHSLDVEFEGDATFTQVPVPITLPVGHPLNPTPNPLPLDVVISQQFGEAGPFVQQDVGADLQLPAQLAVGVGFQATPALQIVADYQRTWWSAWDVTTIDFAGPAPDADLVLDYQDTNTFLLGAQFAASDLLTLRGGFRHNSAAQRDASVSPLLPEAERNYYSAGLGLNLMRALRVDLAFQLVDQEDRAGRVRPRESLEQTAEELNVGTYSADAQVFTASLTYRFGGPR